MWHLCDMPTSPRNVRLSGYTGCERLTVKAVLLSQLGHSLAFGKRAFQEPNLLENKGVP
jgi:hypothetical protein